MTVFLTVLSGVLVFVMGQILLKLFIEPIQDFRKLISQVSFDLIKSANILANPAVPVEQPFADACQIMREHSSNLHAHFYLVPFYKVTSRLFGLPSEDSILKATKELIRLSNGSGGVLTNQGVLNSYAIQNVKVALGIAIPASEWLDPELEKEFIKGN